MMNPTNDEIIAAVENLHNAAHPELKKRATVLLQQGQFGPMAGIAGVLSIVTSDDDTDPRQAIEMLLSQVIGDAVGRFSDSDFEINCDDALRAAVDMLLRVAAEVRESER